MMAAQQIGCPVYDRNDRRNLDAAIHLVGDESRASLARRGQLRCPAGESRLGRLGRLERRPPRSPLLPSVLRPADAEASRRSSGGAAWRPCLHPLRRRQSAHAPGRGMERAQQPLFDCVDVEACADRRGICYACGHEWRWHTRGGMCQRTSEGI
jgi:hypothetical protein